MAVGCYIIIFQFRQDTVLCTKFKNTSTNRRMTIHLKILNNRTRVIIYSIFLSHVYIDKKGTWEEKDGQNGRYKGKIIQLKFKVQKRAAQ